jgi:hypothetical protein
MVLAPFSPPIAQFCPYGAGFKPSNFYAAGSSASAHHRLTLIIVYGSSFVFNLCIFSISTLEPFIVQ